MKKTKIAALIAILAAAIAGGVKTGIFQGKCRQLEDAILEIEDESIRSALIIKLAGTECMPDVEKHIKCWERPNGNRCINGRLYGKGKGGTTSCTKTVTSTPCLHHEATFTESQVKGQGSYELKMGDILKRVTKHRDKLERLAGGDR